MYDVSYLMFFIINSYQRLNELIFQARLHEIIISSAKAKNTEGPMEFPWMVDGAGLPANASQLLPKMVKYFYIREIHILAHFLQN